MGSEFIAWPAAVPLGQKLSQAWVKKQQWFFSAILGLQEDYERFSTKSSCAPCTGQKRPWECLVWGCAVKPFKEVRLAF